MYGTQNRAKIKTEEITEDKKDCKQLLSQSQGVIKILGDRHLNEAGAQGVSSAKRLSNKYCN